MSIRPFRDIKRKKTRIISIGNVKVGGDASIAVQSMTNTLTTNISETINQINQLSEAGADLVRVSCPDKESSFALKEIVKNINVPLIADIHFHYKRAIEAAEAGIKVIITITEGIPISDMIKVKNHLNKFSCIMVGPNCPGVITPDEAKVGIMPEFIFKKGKVGIISKSGTLTYEAADQIVKQGFGISTAIGIGGDPIIGTTVKDAMEMFVNDSETECIVMIGEIGGQLEAEAAKWYNQSNSKKPVVGFIAGETAPRGRTMGHAGAIVGGSDDTARAKKKILNEYGVNVVDSPAEIGKKVHSILS